MDFVPYEGQPLSNSALASVLRELTGEPAFFGDEKYLIFGNELHKRLLEPEEELLILDDTQEDLLDEMVATLKKHPLMVMEDGDQNEIDCHGKIKNTPFHGFLDKKRGKLGVDLKTTSVTTEAAFLKSADKFAYWRQAYIYKKIAKLTDFVFLAASKKNTSRIFEIHTVAYPRQMRRAKFETEFLINVIHKYGIPRSYANRTKRDDVRKPNKQNENE